MKNNPANMSTAALAFLGDAVYSLYIRQRLIENGMNGGRADKMHKAAACYVCAGAQASAAKAILDSLSEEERSVLIRARNHQMTSKARHTDIVTYKWATGFEALLGFLELSGRKDRLNEVMDQAWKNYESCKASRMVNLGNAKQKALQENEKESEISAGGA